MNKYQELCKKISSNVKPGTTRASRSDLIEMAQTLLNTPEHTFDVYLKDSEGKNPTVIQVNPTKDYREALKNVLVKDFGVDKEEANKIMDIPFSKKHAEAITDLSTFLIKDHLNVGRKVIFPITSKTESQMEIAQVHVDEKVTEIAKIAQGPDGTYTRELTGKTRKTAAHDAIQAKNKVPGWLLTDM